MKTCVPLSDDSLTWPSPEKGGLTANNSVFRYNAASSDDGVGGEEGAFSLCTLWAVEALTRAGVYHKPYMEKS